VASIAFGEEVPAIDGNVQRVISRLACLEKDPTRGETRGLVESLVRALLQGHPPDRLNQALMELGALVCKPGPPRCELCPWMRRCRARREGVQELLPRRAPRVEASRVSCYAAVIRDRERYLWRRRPEGTHNAGLWELPTTPWHGGEPETGRAEVDLVTLGRELDRDWSVGEALAGIRHSITRYRVRCVAHRVDDAVVVSSEDLRWATAAEAEALGLTAASRKLLEALPSLL
jgi:A/G-specific adenine glycosylase